MRPLFAGPEGWARYMAGYSLTSPDALLGSGVIAGDGTASVTVERHGRRVVQQLAPVAEPRREVPDESWWFLSPAHPAAAGWRHVLAGRALPAHIDRPARWYGLRRCAGNILYLAFSRAEDQPGRPTLAAFAAEVRDALAAAPAARLVVDLRFNTGGNLQKTRALFEAIARGPLGRERRLFALLGPATFSAGITPAAILKQGGAILIGAAPGDRTRFWAEGGNVVLPHSGLILHYADRAHLYAAGGPPVAPALVYLRLDAGPLTPDRPADATFADYLAGRDPVAGRVEPGGLRCAPAPGDDG